MKMPTPAVPRILTDLHYNMENLEFDSDITEIPWSDRKQWMESMLEEALANGVVGTWWTRSGNSLVLVSVDEHG
jgi:hypothetical protein